MACMTIIYCHLQINDSAETSKQKVQCHFETVRTLIQDALTSRLNQLVEEIELIKIKSLQPLQQCEDLISEAIGAASTVMEQGIQGHLDRFLFSCISDTVFSNYRQY